MELQLVNFTQAIALKELGFPQRTRDYDKWYNQNKVLDNYTNQDTYKCYAPTLELVAKWLRDEYNIFIEIMLDLGGGYNVKYCKLPWTNTLFDNEVGFFEDYEEALSAGIDKAIEMLK